MNFKLKIVLILVTLYSCKTPRENNTEIIKKDKIQINEVTHNFGEINVGDTIKYSFFLKNLSRKKLIIKNIGTSCGCTTTGVIDSIAEENQEIEIPLKFIAKEEQIGQIVNSAVVEMNTEPPYRIFRLQGVVKPQKQDL